MSPLPPLRFFRGACACAIPLALACGGRTPETAPESRHFVARLEFPTTGDAKPQGLLTLDLDGDGRDELIAIASSPGSLQIWTGLTNLVQQSVEAFAISIDDFALGPVWLGGERPATPAARAEIVFASRSLPGITAVDVRAAVRSKPGEPLVALWRLDLDRRPRVLASGDLGRDGRPDIALITVDDDLLLVRSRDDVITTRLAGEQACCAAFANDGRALFVGFQGSRRLVRYEFDAAGHAVEKGAAQLDGLPRSIDEITAAGLGKPLLLVAGGDDRVWTFSIDNGAIVAGKAFSTSAIPIDIVHGEIAHGGTPELVALGLHGQQALVYTLTSDAMTELARFYAGQHPFACALGDFDGDKKLDLAISNGDAKRVGIAFGSGDGRFDVARDAGAGRAPHSLALGDLDGDGKLDVVALSALEGTLSTLANKNGVLAAREIHGPAQSADAVRCVDLDGDGHLDAAFLRRVDRGSVLCAYFGDGHGRLWQRAEVAPVDVGASSGDWIVTDLDGDGALEAIVSDPEGGRVALVPIRRVKDAGVSFEPARAIDVVGGPKAMTLIDASAEAKPEIAVALAGPGKRFGVALLRATKDASGALVLGEVDLLPLTVPAIALAAADFDGDGTQDLAVIASKSESDNNVRIFYQSKEHAWSSDAPPLPTGLRPYALRAGDIDGNGTIDLVCSAQNSHHVNLWINGGGTPVSFVRSADLGAGTGPLDIQLADLDGDGQLEILVANSFSNDISVIRTR